MALWFEHQKLSSHFSLCCDTPTVTGNKTFANHSRRRLWPLDRRKQVCQMQLGKRKVFLCRLRLPEQTSVSASTGISSVRQSQHTLPTWMQVNSKLYYVLICVVQCDYYKHRQLEWSALLLYWTDAASSSTTAAQNTVLNVPYRALHSIMLALCLLSWSATLVLILLPDQSEKGTLMAANSLHIAMYVSVCVLFFCRCFFVPFCCTFSYTVIFSFLKWSLLFPLLPSFHLRCRCCVLIESWSQAKCNVNFELLA